MELTLGLVLFVLEAGIFLMLLVLLLYGVYKVLSLLLRTLLSNLSASTGRSIRFLGFALGLWLFPEPGRYFLNVMDQVLHGLFINFPNALFTSTERIVATCSEINEACWNNARSALWESTMQLSQSLLNAFQIYQAPLLDIVLLFSVWIIISGIINSLFRAGDERSVLHTEGDQAESRQKRFGPIARQNTLTGTLLLFSLLLCLSSIAAIESLKDKGDVRPDLTKEKLTENLISVKLDRETFDKLYPADIGDTRTDAYTPPTGAPPTDFEVALRLFTEQTPKFLKTWSELRDYYFQQQEKMLAQGVLTFDVANLQRKGGRETAQHFLDIFDWFQQWTDAYQQHLNDCRGRISSYISQVNTLDVMVHGLSGPSDTSGLQRQQAYDLLRSASMYSRDVVDACRNSGSSWAPPARPEYGTFLGPLGVLFRWLLATESYPMALIVGLFGMGLLGATSSSFILHGVLGTRFVPGQLWAPNLMGVIARGISAAILVYVASYGGLLILASGDAEPNAYLVLTICLIASVFSEKAWLWAQDKLSGQLQSGGGTAEGVASAPPSPPAHSKGTPDE